MGLTQVMLQVKGCEMVCKQRELIPGPKQQSQALSSRVLPFLSGLSNCLRQRQQGCQPPSKRCPNNVQTPHAYKNELGVRIDSALFPVHDARTLKRTIRIKICARPRLWHKYLYLFMYGLNCPFIRNGEKEKSLSMVVCIFMCLFVH